MTTPTQDIQTILERLEKLERQTRRLKQAGAMALIAIGALVFMGQALPKNRTVEATEFILKDDGGKVKAKLYMHSVGPRLSLYDASGVETVMLTQGAYGGSLLMKSNPTAKFPELQLFLTPDGPGLNLIGTHKGLVTLTTAAPGPQLAISDAEGYQASVGVSRIEVPQTGEKQTTSAASFALVGKDGKVIWRAP